MCSRIKQDVSHIFLPFRCPRDAIEELFSVISDRDNSNKASRRLRNVLGDAVFVKSVSLEYLGSCLRDGGETRTDPTGEEDGPAVGSNNNNRVPVIRNPLDRINVTAGELLRFRVPEDTCYDQEDGSTSGLALHLLTMNRKELTAK